MVRTHPLLPAVTTLSAHTTAIIRPSLRTTTTALRACLCRGVSYVISPRPHATHPTHHRVAPIPRPTTNKAFSFPTPAARHPRRPMSSSSSSPPATAASASPAPSSTKKFTFGPFDVSTQVFYETPCSFALVNLKPLLPGHVLVCPKKPHRRLTDLTAAELVDLFAAVQVAQRMLAAVYFVGSGAEEEEEEQVRKGSFNIAVQDGPEAGQTVPHVHVHVLPRIRGATAKDAATEGDALYEQMAEEPGNVGGAQWDAASDQERQGSSRPQPGGRFPRIEDSSRKARPMAVMEAEAALFRQALADLGIAQGQAQAVAVEKSADS